MPPDSRPVNWLVTWLYSPKPQQSMIQWNHSPMITRQMPTKATNEGQQINFVHTRNCYKRWVISNAAIPSNAEKDNSSRFQFEQSIFVSSFAQVHTSTICEINSCNQRIHLPWFKWYCWTVPKQTINWNYLHELPRYCVSDPMMKIESTPEAACI